MSKSKSELDPSAIEFFKSWEDIGSSSSLGAPRHWREVLTDIENNSSNELKKLLKKMSDEADLSYNGINTNYDKEINAIRDYLYNREEVDEYIKPHIVNLLSEKYKEVKEKVFGKDEIPIKSGILTRVKNSVLKTMGLRKKPKKRNITPTTIMAMEETASLIKNQSIKNKYALKDADSDSTLSISSNESDSANIAAEKVSKGLSKVKIADREPNSHLSNERKIKPKVKTKR